MKKLKQWVSHLSVKKKLVFYGYLIFTPVLVLICLVLLFYSYKSAVNGQLETNVSNVNMLSDSINVLQTEIKDFSTYICINNAIYDLLVSSNPEEKNKNAKLWLEEAPMQLVQDMISLKGHIKTIAIYPENGIRPYLRCMDGSSYLSDIEMVRNTDIYLETLKSDNGMVWKNVPKGTGEIYLSNHSDKVVLYREIVDLTQKKRLGYIVIGVSQEQFQELSENLIQDKSESVLILDKNGGELSRSGKLDEKVEKYLKSAAFIKENYQNRKEHFVYEDYEIICKQIDNNASIVCKIVPKKGIKELIPEVVYIPVTLFLGVLVGLMPLLIIISNIITKPLNQLSKAIYKLSTGDFEQHVKVTTDDEVGEVAKGFNQMVEAIKILIEENYVIALREKESEMAALQAQINPHFLYNTLDSLYWQTMGSGNDEVAESILALSQLFRMVLGKGEKEVSVRHEIELISYYLQIQKMRLSKRLEYEIVLEKEIEDARMPKLLLQPFVENAIVHGFENVSVPCKLTVTGKREDNYICFQVRDTGIGMRPDQIAAIWEEETAQYKDQRIGRYAIKNIKERLELKYRGDFVLDIQSNLGKGTTVTLKIPYERGVNSADKIIGS